MVSQVTSHIHQRTFILYHVFGIVYSAINISQGNREKRVVCPRREGEENVPDKQPPWKRRRKTRESDTAEPKEEIYRGELPRSQDRVNMIGKSKDLLGALPTVELPFRLEERNATDKND